MRTRIEKTLQTWNEIYNRNNIPNRSEQMWWQTTSFTSSTEILREIEEAFAVYHFIYSHFQKLGLVPWETLRRIVSYMDYYITRDRLWI